MLNLELTDYGVYDTIKEIKDELELVVGNKVSKKQKEEAICKSIGALNALWNLVTINDPSNEPDL